MGSEKNTSWAVIGGGLLGLTLALRLREQGKQVTLIEGGDSLGGLASAWQLGDVTWDRHYHVTLLSDRFTRGIVDDIGLADKLRWKETKTGFYGNGRLSPLSSSIDYLRLPALGLIEKLRLAATILYASRVKDWKPLEEIPVSDWLTRLSGRKVFERLWKPLLRAKLGDNYTSASAAFIWAVIARLYAARRTGLKKEMFGYVEGGYAAILAAFERKLSSSGVNILTGHRVRTIRKVGEGFAVSIDGRHDLTFDRVVATCPAPLIGALAPDLAPAEREQLQAIRYQGIVCASLLLKRPLADSYLTYITDEMPFTAVVEMSTLVNPEAFGGRSLVYLPKYLASEDKDFLLRDDEIEKRFLAALERMYPAFRREDVLAFRVSRVRHVLPIPTIGFSKIAPPVQTSVPGLFIATSAQIVNGTLNVNETIQLAESVAASLTEADTAPLVHLREAA